MNTPTNEECSLKNYRRYPKETIVPPLKKDANTHLTFPQGDKSSERPP